MLNEQTLLRSSVWLSLGTLFQKLTTVFLIILIARLGSIHLGIFYTYIHFFQQFTNLAVMLLGTLYMHSLRIHADKNNLESFSKVASISLRVGLFYGVLASVFFSLLTIFLFQKYYLEDWLLYLLLLLIASPFRIISSHIYRLLLLIQRFNRAIFIQNIFGSLFHLLLAFSLIILLGLGVLGGILAQTINFMVLGIVSFWIFHQVFPKGLHHSSSASIKYIPSKMGFAVAVSTFLASSIDIIIIILLLGFKELGLYIVAIYIPSLLLNIPSAFFWMFYPVATIEYLKGRDINKLAQKVFLMTFLIILPLFYIIINFTDSIVLFLFGRHYATSPNLLLIFSIAYILRAVSSILLKVIYAYKQYARGVLCSITFVLIYVISGLILIPKFGLKGTAEAYLIASFLELITLLIFQYSFQQRKR